MLLAKTLGIPHWDKITTLRELVEAVDRDMVLRAVAATTTAASSSPTPASDMSLSSLLIWAIPHLLPLTTYSHEKLDEVLGMKPTALPQFRDDPRALRVLKANREFCLASRATHVLSEHERVLSFRRVCDQYWHHVDSKKKEEEEGGKGNGTQESTTMVLDTCLRELGRLMNDSHASCRDDYECSCDELDELTSLALKEGALGRYGFSHSLLFLSLSLSLSLCLVHSLIFCRCYSPPSISLTLSLSHISLLFSLSLFFFFFLIFFFFLSIFQKKTIVRSLRSRLTGAGWGGSSVSLVRENDAEKFISALSRSYYSGKGTAAKAASSLAQEDYLFASKPAAGACILKVSL